MSALETCGMRQEISVGNAASYGLVESVDFRLQQVSTGGGRLVSDVAGARIPTSYIAEHLLPFRLRVFMHLELKRPPSK